MTLNFNPSTKLWFWTVLLLVGLQPPGRFSPLQCPCACASFCRPWSSRNRSFVPTILLVAVHAVTATLFSSSSSLLLLVFGMLLMPFLFFFLFFFLLFLLPLFLLLLLLFIGGVRRWFVFDNMCEACARAMYIGCRSNLILPI